MSVRVRASRFAAVLRAAVVLRASAVFRALAVFRASTVLRALAAGLALLALSVGSALLIPTLALASSPSAPSASGFSVESENPIEDQGSNFNYRSYITSITPRVPGLSAEVLEFADRLLLRNNTGKTVTIYGYSGEPYARIQPRGATELNVRAPAAYLNTNFYADVTVPASASPNASPKWKVVDRAGQFEWHDHRIHWMSPVLPPQVKDKGKRTKIFNWSVPISVGTQRGSIDGQLYWVPEGSSVPTAAIIALVVVLLAAIVFVVVVRRRRARSGASGAPSGGSRTGRSGGSDSQKEAW